MEDSPPHGWYPDPSRRGRQRLWDGTRWTDQVRRVPGQPARPAWLAPVIVAGVVLVVVGVGLLAYGLGRGPETAASSPAPPQPTPSSATGPAGTAPAGPDPAVCAVGDPSYRASHPEDERLHGGGLAMPTPGGWAVTDPAQVAYAFDVVRVTAPEDAGWAALGAVRIEDPFSTPEQASATITGCLQDGAEPGTLRVAHSRATSIPGAHRAHEYVGVLHRGGRTQEFRVVVADLHSPESLAIYVRVVDPDSAYQGAITTAEAGLAGA